MPCYDCDVKPLELHKKKSIVASKTFTIALIGSPNVGKTSLFNGLTGLRARTANFPGTTVERKTGRLKLEDRNVEIIDLPGIYSLKAATPEERIASDVLIGNAPGVPKPDIVVVIADAMRIERSLFLVSQVLEQNLRVIVALNMIDLAQRNDLHIDVDHLSRELGCQVIPTVARSGQGLDELENIIKQSLPSKSGESVVSASPPIAFCKHCNGCPFQSRYAWSEQIASRCVTTPAIARGQYTEIIDRYLTHPVLGLVAFLTVMLSVFYLIFSVANIPMDLIDALFARTGALIAEIVPQGRLQSLLVDGIIGGVGGMLVFLPQICILFFFLAILEDSGYLARAAFVMDRLMRRIGLPGTAFVPLLSAHACAVPAIMATRVIRDTRDRLVTILVAPLMTCSARIPVYAMVTALLFPNHPGRAALVFAGAYTLGITAALAMAFIFKKTILPGESKPLILELPEYRMPGLKTAFIHTWDRGKIFVQQAGTIIMIISIILWTLSSFPSSDPSARAMKMKSQAERLLAEGKVNESEELGKKAEQLINREALSNSFAGQLGRMIEPIVRPLGFDWQIGIGIISSFAAREVIVSTLAIVYGVGDDTISEDPSGLYTTLRKAHRSDGSPVFTTATSISLLVFYVLAMQCLPTQAITRRETDGWKWPIFQLLYMTFLAYTASLITYQTFHFFGIG